MKKRFAALLLLTACEASDPGNLFGTTTPPASVPGTAMNPALHHT